MDKLEVFALAEFDDAAAHDRAAQLARVEIKACGTSLVRENRYASGRASPQHEPFSDDTIENKFRDNARGCLTADRIDRLADGLWNLESVQNVSTLMAFARTG